MYSRRVWQRGSNAKNGPRWAPDARGASQAEGGQGASLVIFQPPVPVLHRRHRRGHRVLGEDLLVRLHHVRVVQVVVHNHPTLALKQNLNATSVDNHIKTCDMFAECLH